MKYNANHPISPMLLSCFSHESGRADSTNPNEHVVHVAQGGLLIPAIGQPYSLHEHQVAVYLLRPRDNITLLRATDSTIFVSDLPELRDYEFLCIPRRDDRNPSKVRYTYQVTRV